MLVFFRFHWLVLPFRYRNNFISYVKHIIAFFEQIFKAKIIPFSLEFILKIFPIANFSPDFLIKYQALRTRLIKYIQFLYKEKKEYNPGNHYRRTLIVIIGGI